MREWVSPDGAVTVREDNLPIIEIGGRALRIGPLDRAMHETVKPHLLRMKALSEGGLDASPEALAVQVSIAALFLAPCAPDITGEWLAEHMTAQQSQEVATEFVRQMIELQMICGRGGHA